MGSNAEIRQRMETYRKVLLALVWIGGIALMIGGLIMISYKTGGRSSYPLRPYGIALLIVSILGSIIGHFLVNVGLAIPFILLNNGDILESMKKNVADNASSTIANTSGRTIVGNNLQTLSSSGDEFIVTANTFIRNSPNFEAKQEKPLTCGDKVILQNVFNENPDWFFIKTSDGKEGWCSSGYLEKC